jgi:hypothetical protein
MFPLPIYGRGQASQVSKPPFGAGAERVSIHTRSLTYTTCHHGTYVLYCTRRKCAMSRTPTDPLPGVHPLQVSHPLAYPLPSLLAGPATSSLAPVSTTPMRTSSIIESRKEACIRKTITGINTLTFIIPNLTRLFPNDLALFPRWRPIESRQSLCYNNWVLPTTTGGGV